MDLDRLVPDFLRASYARKFGAMAVVLLAAVLLLGVLTQGAVNDQLTEQQRETLLTNAEQEGNSLAQWVETERSTIRTLSKHQDLTGGTPDHIRRTLRTELTHLPEEVAHLHYVDRANETVYASTDQSIEGEGIEATQITWPQATGFENVSFESVDTVVQTWMFRDDGTPSVAFASPVPNSDKLLISVIRTSERAEDFSSAINGTTTTVIGDTTADILFSTNESAFLTTYQSRGGENMMETIKAQDQGTVVTEDTILAFTAIEGVDNNWAVVKETPKSTALAIAQSVQQRIWMLVGLTLVGLLGFVGIIRYGPMRSFQEIAVQARGIADGDLEQDIADDDRIDEVGQVRGAFHEILAYLQTVEGQAIALSEQDFDDEILEEEVPGTLGDSLSAMHEDLERFIEDLEAARSEAEASKEEAQALAHSLEEQAAAFSEQMEAAANGDLTQRLDPDVENEALQQIADAFNDMLEQLEELVTRIQTTADQVEEQTLEMTASTDEIEQSSMDVAESIEEISAGAERQNEKLATATEEMTDLSATVEEIASSSDSVATQAEAAADMGQDGQQAAEETIAEMDAIESKATETVTEMESLQDEVERISEIVAMIDDIAGQTDMLAVNASIEAATADGEGDGFSVVADEVKALAEDTAEATDEVETLIEDVQDSTDAVAQDMYDMRDRIDEGQASIDRTVSLLQDIVDRVADANAGIQSINEATDDQAESVQEATQMVEDVASVSDQTASEASNVSAAAEEQTSAIQQIAQSASTLEDQAQELLDRTEQFETK